MGKWLLFFMKVGRANKYLEATLQLEYRLGKHNFMKNYI